MLARCLAPLALALSLSTLSGAQQSIGMFGVPAHDEVVVFDADADAILATLPVDDGPFTACYDCAILEDLSLGFVATGKSEVWVIDLGTSPPSLAGGTNPIPITGSGSDLVISRDQRYLLVETTSSLSVVDLAARAEIGTYAFDDPLSSVDVAGDGSILLTLFEGVNPGDDAIRRLSLDASGNVTDTGDSLLLPRFPNNAYFDPSGTFGVVFLRDLNQVLSFETVGLNVVDVTTLQGDAGDDGACGAFDVAGNRLYAMSTQFRDTTTISRHGYDPVSGAVADVPVWSTSLPEGAIPCGGVELMVLHPGGEKLYVTEFSSVLSILDTDDGALAGTISVAQNAISGVCVAQRAECFLVLGGGSGAAAFQAGGHTWSTQLGSVASSYPVTLDDIPSFPLPDLPRRTTVVPPTRVHETSVQVLMWNPTVFPANPEQWSQRLDVTLWSNGRVTARRAGTRDGIDLELEVVRDPDGRRRARFPFSIDGL